MKGFSFGFIDNLIVAISAITGVHIDNYFSGLGVNGALYGALIGHTLSDLIAGYLDFGLEIALNMALGCISVILIVYIYTLIDGEFLKNVN
tara:strand:+ start:2806 stop:3078 length:273 start_codon:yes stop_codon:yes gene_type:complete